MIAIVGVGLIGGSFALAVRKAGFKGRVVGVSSPATTGKAVKLSVIDAALPLAEAAAQAELIYLAQPIEGILKTLDVLDEFVQPGTLITDVGSTKGVIVERAAQKIRRGRFVGGHPMAGKETSGVENAEAGLFEGRPYVLTSSDPEMENWVQRIGARLVRMDASEHDRRVARASHLPQVLSTVFAAMAGSETQVAGPGAMSMTRLAFSSYHLWRDILATNTAEIDAALGEYIRCLEQARQSLPDLEKAFVEGERGAQQLRNSRSTEPTS